MSFHSSNETDHGCCVIMIEKDVMELMKNLEEKTISSKIIYDGRVVKLVVDNVILPNGEQSKREIVRHSGAVAVLAVTAEEKLVLVRQYRKALGKTTLEIPAGKLEAEEQPIDCAIRELEEETGYRANTLKPLYSFYTSPGFANEIIHLFEAEGLQKGEAHLDQDEFIELVEYSIEECFQAIEAEEICDAKTILAVHLWKAKQSIR